MPAFRTHFAILGPDILRFGPGWIQASTDRATDRIDVKAVMSDPDYRALYNRRGSSPRSSWESLCGVTETLHFRSGSIDPTEIRLTVTRENAPILSIIQGGLQVVLDSTSAEVIAAHHRGTDFRIRNLQAKMLAGRALEMGGMMAIPEHPLLENIGAGSFRRPLTPNYNQALDFESSETAKPSSIQLFGSGGWGAVIRADQVENLLSGVQWAHDRMEASNRRHGILLQRNHDGSVGVGFYPLITVDDNFMPQPSATHSFQSIPGVQGGLKAIYPIPSILQDWRAGRATKLELIP